MDSHCSPWNLVHTEWLAAHQAGTIWSSDVDQTGYTSMVGTQRIGVAA